MHRVIRRDKVQTPSAKFAGWWFLFFLVLAGASGVAEDKTDFLIDKLRNASSFKVRLKAAVLLGRMADPRAVDPLCNALKDENYVVRGAAARALGNLGHPMAISAIDPLLGLVGDEEPFVRTEVVGSLERLSGEQSQGAFVTALGDHNPVVRLTAVRILAKMTLPGAHSSLIATLGDADEAVREETITLVRGFEAQERESLLLEALSKNDLYEVQTTAAKLVGELKITAAMNQLVTLLGRDDVVPQVKREVAQALTQMKDRIQIESLVEQINSEDHQVRVQAIALLGIEGGQKAVDALLSLLNDKDARVRIRVISALGEAGDPRVVPSLEKLLQAESDSRVHDTIKRNLRILQAKRSP